MKGKPLLPTLRTKKRYFVYQVVSDFEFKREELTNALFASFKEYYGIIGLGNAGLIDTKIYDNKLKRGIIKINNDSCDQFRASTVMVTEIKGKEIRFLIVGVSGILRKAKTRYLSRR